jgi:predicted Zn-dependent protease
MSQGMYEGQGGSGFPMRLILAVILALVSFITYYSKSVINPVTGKKQHIDLSVNQEIALGLQAVPQMEAQYGGEVHDMTKRDRVLRVFRRLVERTAAGKTPYKFTVHLLNDTKTINAFALPGGQVFMTLALLQHLTTDGQIAGVLGHEIGHVIARHGAEHLAQEQLTQGLVGAAVVASSDPNDPQRGARNAAIAAAVANMVNLRFSRDDELQADQLGVHFMADAGYDPRSMLAVMKVLQDVEASGHAPPEFFSTHPNPAHRTERIQAAIQRLFPDGVPTGLEK